MMCLVVIYVWRGSTLSQSPGTVETHANTISGFPVCSLLKCAALLMRQQTLSCVAHNIPVSFQHDYENLVGLQRAPEGSRQWRIPSFSIRVVFRSFDWGGVLIFELFWIVLCCSVLFYVVLCCVILLLDGVMVDVAGSSSCSLNSSSMEMCCRLSFKKMILTRFSFKKSLNLSST